MNKRNNSHLGFLLSPSASMLMDLVYKCHRGDCHSEKKQVSSDSLWDEHGPCAEVAGSWREAVVLDWSLQK